MTRPSHSVRLRLSRRWKFLSAVSLVAAEFISSISGMAAEPTRRPLVRTIQPVAHVTVAENDPTQATPAAVPGSSRRVKPVAADVPVEETAAPATRSITRKIQPPAVAEEGAPAPLANDIDAALGVKQLQPTPPTGNDPVPVAEEASEKEVQPTPALAPVVNGSRKRVTFQLQDDAPAGNIARNNLQEAGPIDLTNPFEVIGEQDEKIVLMVRRSKLLRTKVNIYRTAVVDSGVVEIVQFTPREISLIGKSTGTTHVTFWFEQQDSKPITYLVRVEPDVERVKELEDQYRLLEDVINEMHPDSKIELLVVADKLIVKGQAKDGEEAGHIISLIRSQGGGGGGGIGGGLGGFGGGGGSLGEGTAANVLSDSATGSTNRARLNVINMLRVPGVQQVSLRVKIAELSRSAGRGFGVSVKGNVNLTNNPNGSKLILNSLAAAAGGTGSAIIAQVDGDDISIGLKYLQQSGVIRLLSEPTLVTMSGRPATFHAGGEIAVPTLIGGAGVNAVTTDFRAFGAVISFLPTVIDKDRIRLSVSPEFSQVNTGLAVGGTPGFNTRSATTTVEMREGQTLAIAGLLEDNMSANKRGDVPFVSWLFGDRSVTHNETELIILVTPDMVHPMDPEEVPPLPGFDVTEPNNTQFFLQGRLEGNPTYDYRSTVWPRLRKRYGGGGSAMISGPFGHGQ